MYQAAQNLDSISIIDKISKKEGKNQINTSKTQRVFDLFEFNPINDWTVCWEISVGEIKMVLYFVCDGKGYDNLKFNWKVIHMFS